MIGEQHDDHIWLTVLGEAWAIRAIKRPASGSWWLFLWRGYGPHIEHKVLMLPPTWDFTHYTDVAQGALEASEATRQ